MLTLLVSLEFSPRRYQPFTWLFLVFGSTLFYVLDLDTQGARNDPFSKYTKVAKNRHFLFVHLDIRGKEILVFRKKIVRTTKRMIPQKDDSWTWAMQRIYVFLLKTFIVQEPCSLFLSSVCMLSCNSDFLALIQNRAILQ